MYTENDFPPHLSARNRKPTFEEKLGKYKNRMELIRTGIGIVVLIIQFVILYQLLTTK
jgi:hypothetical protein